MTFIGDNEVLPPPRERVEVLSISHNLSILTGTGAHSVRAHDQIGVILVVGKEVDPGDLDAQMQIGAIVADALLKDARSTDITP